jgi:RecB family exonuclease
MIELNLSPTSLNLYEQSQMQFYFEYIAKADKDTNVPECYGVAGNIVHSLLEKYNNQDIYDIKTHFNMLWEEQGLGNLLDIKGNLLSKEKYFKCVERGVDLSNIYDIISKDEEIKIPFLETKNFNIGLKGIIDVIAKDSESVLLIDWKTSNSKDKSGKFRTQALFYSYLYYKEYDVVPKAVIFQYLKNNEVDFYNFNKDDLLDFEEYLNKVAREISDKGTDINNYELGNYENIFNAHLDKCGKEFMRRHYERNN